ncbi:MAG: glycosyltransferase family 9 protein [Deltaproteobacteria bacterium]|nr:glycosyltransferase family 9 protein [Deltaproteobacteria bacterium]
MTNKKSIKDIPMAPSILIILMGSLGDVARGLCLVSHIKDHLPTSKVSWLIEKRRTDMVGFNPRLDRVIVFDRSRGISGVWDLYQSLRRKHFDIALDLQRIFKSGFFSLLSGAERRIGFHRKNTKEFNWLLNNEYIPYFSEDRSKLEHYLKFTEYLELPKLDTADFGFATLDVNRTVPPSVAEIQGTFIAVVMGSSWDSKDWNFSGYHNFVRYIIETQNRHVVLLGGNSQMKLAADLVEKLNSPNVIDLTGNSLLEMTAVLKAAAAAVGPDSGPGHLAAAVGTPYVTLFGPTPAKRHAPYGCEHLVVQSSLNCAPCYQKQCPEGNKRCMENIEVGDVAEKISQALAETTD